MRHWAVVLLLLLPEAGLTQSWWISAGMGASQHEFYSLTDYLSGFGDEVGSGQTALTSDFHVGILVTDRWGLGGSWIFDLADLSASLGTNTQTYSYSASGFVLHPFYRFNPGTGLLLTAGPEFGFQQYTLETTGVGAALPKELESTGKSVGIRVTGALNTGGAMNICLTAGARLKESDPVRFGNASFDFKSLDAWIRFGILIPYGI